MTEPFDRLPDLPLTAGFVDRQTSSRGDEAWVAERWNDPTSRVLLVGDGHVPYDDRDSQTRLRWRTTAESANGERYLLGLGPDGVAYFAVHVDALPDDGPQAGLRQLGGLVSAMDAELLVHAVALDNWHRSHRCCPRCGAPTQVVKAGAERRCPADGSAHFPRTDPAVIVLVTDSSGRALLGRQASWPAGRYSTLAGFVEPGESAEQAVIREVAEESGVAVTDVQYVRSQPWPFPSSLMLGFVAHGHGDDPRADGEEIAEVRWFDRQDFGVGVESGSVVPPGPISIARRLIERWFGGSLPTGPEGALWR